MATYTRSGAPCAPLAPPHTDVNDDAFFALHDFEAELRRLNEANQQLIDEFHLVDDDSVAAALEPAHGVDAEELAQLREENLRLKNRVEELEAQAAGNADELWQERQREYEMLLEEKSEVIRGLHEKISEMQESVSFTEESPAAVAASSVRLGQAEEILRLKREMEEQRRQLEQDEQDMMAHMRQMELTMANERAELARQRQELLRQQTDLARDTENANRDPELRDKLHSLRRTQEPKLAAPQSAEVPIAKKEQKSSGFFRRMFG